MSRYDPNAEAQRQEPDIASDTALRPHPERRVRAEWGFSGSALELHGA